MSTRDGDEMRKRLCPYKSHCERDRIIHKKGLLYRGMATTKDGVKHPVTSRYGIAAGNSDIYGIAITFQDRSTHITDNDEGDILLLGRGNFVSTQYFNDSDYIKATGVLDVFNSAVIETNFKRTKKVANISLLPYKRMGVPANTVCSFSSNPTKGEVSTDVISLDSGGSSPFHGTMVDVNTGKVILKVTLNTVIGETGDELLFKHDIPENIDYNPMFDTPIGYGVNVAVVSIKRLFSYYFIE